MKLRLLTWLPAEASNDIPHHQRKVYRLPAFSRLLAAAARPSAFFSAAV